MADDTVQGTAAGEPYLAYRGTAFFPSLDGLRFLCIMAVLWHHSPLKAELVGSSVLVERGFLGVDFFFVLSGFLITTLLLRERANDGSISLVGFYWRRALRILPIYFFVVTAIGGFFIFIKGRYEYLEIWPYYYVFLSNYLISDIPNLDPTWSLAVEEQYYLIWPLLLIAMPRRAVIPVLAVLVAITHVTPVLYMNGALEPVRTEVLELTLPGGAHGAILLGSLLACLLHSERGFRALHRALGHPRSRRACGS